MKFNFLIVLSQLVNFKHRILIALFFLSQNILASSLCYVWIQTVVGSDEEQLQQLSKDLKHWDYFRESLDSVDFGFSKVGEAFAISRGFLYEHRGIRTQSAIGTNSSPVFPYFTAFRENQKIVAMYQNNGDLLGYLKMETAIHDVAFIGVKIDSELYPAVNNRVVFVRSENSLSSLLFKGGGFELIDTVQIGDPQINPKNLEIPAFGWGLYRMWASVNIDKIQVSVFGDEGIAELEFTHAGKFVKQTIKH